MSERLLMNDPSMKHFNLDIETLSTSPRAYIASMACAFFNPWGNERPAKDGIYKACVGLKDETQADRKKDFDTVFWWLNQKPIAIEYGLQEVNSKDLKSMLTGLEAYIGGHETDKDKIIIWVRGSSFNPAILRDAYMEGNFYQPWRHWNEMDDRVLENIKLMEDFPKWIKPEDLHTVAHNPRGDVQNQVNRIQHYLDPKKLGNISGFIVSKEDSQEFLKGPFDDQFHDGFLDESQAEKKTVDVLSLRNGPTLTPSALSKDAADDEEIPF